jgi:hypothetical protein
MRMPGKPGEVVTGAVVPEVVEQQERIEVAGLFEAEARFNFTRPLSVGVAWTICLTGRIDMRSSCRPV